VTIGVVERLKEYAEGKRPVRIEAPPPEFFDGRTSEPIVWYVDHGGTIEIFDLMGYHPETSEELLPVTPEIVERWKEQIRRKPPAQVMNPESYPWFDVKTGRPNIWHSPGENGELEFFSGPGFHPRTGKALTEITQDFAGKLLRDKKEKADALARAKAEQEARIEADKKEKADALARSKAEQEARIEADKKEKADALARAKAEEEARMFAASCDQLAGNPNDQRRHSNSNGVSYNQLRTQIPEAIQVCELGRPAVSKGSYFEVPAGQGRGTS
jgi:hypothetical protein